MKTLTARQSGPILQAMAAARDAEEKVQMLCTAAGAEVGDRVRLLPGNVIAFISALEADAAAAESTTKQLKKR